MGYLVLARKYRPRNFSDIIGQEHVVQTLQNAIKLDRVHHAFVFSGVRGVGKTTAARVLVRALNCEQAPVPEPCDTCASCVALLEGQHVDVVEIDGASHTGVDHIRALRDSAQYMPSAGRFKLFIIDEVHMLSNAAFNALLKLLEEPPAHVKFIFATTEPKKIPVTVLSRCQRFDFRRVTTQMLRDHLASLCARESLALDDSALYAIAGHADGSVRDALSLLDQVVSFAGADASAAQVAACLGAIDGQLVESLVMAVAQRDASAVLAGVTDAANRGYDLAALASSCASHARDIRVSQALGAEAPDLLERSAEDVARLGEQARAREPEDWDRIFTALIAVVDDTGRSPHPKLTLEMGLLRLLQIEPATSVAALLERVDALLAGTTPPVRQAAPPVAAPVARKPAAAPPSPPPPPAPTRRAPSVEAPPVVRSASSAPPPPPAPARAEAGEPSASDASDRWGRVVAAVRSSRPACAPIWENAWVLSLAREGLALAFESGFYLDAARDAENQATLSAAMTAALGVSPALTVKEVPAAERPAHAFCLAAAGEDARDAADTALRQAAAEHPAVQGAVQILDASITDIQPVE